jgi:phenol 2-monooxygenase (NADPH)
MQFHVDGFQAGDPRIRPADPAAAARPAALPDEVDVLIVGCGPAGLVLAAQLAEFPAITTRLVERRSGPLELGQADGVACRTVEMFEAFGLSEELVAEAYWVNETVFWRPDPHDRSRIVRTGRVQDVEDGLSEVPHVILNQARIHDYLLGSMRRSPSRLEPDYGLEVVDVAVGESGGRPVTVTLRRTGTTRAGAEVTVRARYVVGCDGARSAVRQAIGRELHGDTANHAWGVMDVLAVTDFPDIRLKAAIQSDSGNILLIPREGGYLVRLYVDLGELDPDGRTAVRDLHADQVIAIARRVLHPYTLHVKEIAWFSIYEVGQRLTERFDDVPAELVGARASRVFIAGDACHTHSAKAGQGMNVSMQDTFNLGWKLAAVVEGRSPESLLDTYSAERRAVAQELIDFDREWSAIMASPPRDPANPGAAGVDPAELQEYFVRSLRYTAGVATRYRPSPLTGSGTYQRLAKGFTVGMRFHSAPVIRLADAKPVHLGHAARADGRWRLYAFADAAEPGDPASRLRALCEHLEHAPDSPVRRYTPAGADLDSVFDVRAVLQQYHRDVELADLPSLLMPRKGRYGLVDYEKAFTPDPNSDDIFDVRGIAREQGALVVVRPDQYVSHVLPLDAYEELAAFFAPLLLERRRVEGGDRAAGHSQAAKAAVVRQSPR